MRRLSRRSIRLAVLALTMLAAAACSEPAGWVGEDPHAVEGYWVLKETPCDRAPAADCTIAVDAAIAGSDLDDAEIAAASTADWSSGYRDGGGRTVLATTGGIVHASAVILDLADGSRRIVNVLCGGPITTGGGALVSPRTCDVNALLPLGQRVGDEPWFHLP
jgi:hypothetical protein